MHPKMLEVVVDRCKRRSQQGDCPTENAFPVETLEGAVIQLAAERDAAGSAALNHLADAMEKVMPDLAEQVRQRWNAKMAEADAALDQFLQSISKG